MQSGQDKLAGPLRFSYSIAPLCPLRVLRVSIVLPLSLLRSFRAFAQKKPRSPHAFFSAARTLSGVMGREVIRTPMAL